MLHLFTCHGRIMPRLAELLFCIYDTNMAFKHISFLWSEKGMIVGHMGDTALLLGQKTHIAPFGALGRHAFDSTYDIK